MFILYIVLRRSAVVSHGSSHTAMPLCDTAHEVCILR